MRLLFFILILPILTASENKFGCVLIFASNDVKQLDCNNDKKIDTVEIRGQHPTHIFIGKTLMSAHKLAKMYPTNGHDDCDQDYFLEESDKRAKFFLKPIRKSEPILRALRAPLRIIH